MTAQRLARWHWRAGSLSVLVSLLLAMVCGVGAVASSDGSSMVVTSGTALGNAVSPAVPAMAVTRADVRLLANRTGQSMPGSVLGWPLPRYRLVAPTGWRVAAGVAADRVRAIHAGASQGRAPPFAA